MESGAFNVYCYMKNDVDVANTRNCNGIKPKSQNQAVTVNRYNSKARELITDAKCTKSKNLNTI